MAIDVKQLQTIIDNLVTQEMRDFANTPDADKNRLRQLRQKDVLDSFSSNQFLSKLNLIDHIKSLNFFRSVESEIIDGKDDNSKIINIEVQEKRRWFSRC